MIRSLSTPQKLGLLATLYFSQGLPFGFFVQAMPVLLRAQGFSLGDIGLAALLTAPWSLKFLWAPFVDRVYHPDIGRRRSWLLPLQAAAVIVLVSLAALPVDRSTALLLGGVLVLNLIAATQDIATDGLAVDMLAPADRGIANGLQVAGYRVGMIVGGGVLLVAHEHLGSSVTFLAMAGLIAIASIPSLVTPETAFTRSPPETVALPHFLRRPDAVRLLALIACYKGGEAFAGGMLRPFLADSGLGLGDVGWLVGTVGFVAGLAGALAGGALVNRLGRRPALIAFALLQAVTVAGYAYVAATAPDGSVLRAVIGVEHFVGGMATAALFTCMMDWSRPGASATDYTVQASTVVIVSTLATALSGFSAEALGYTGHFALGAGLTLAAVVAVIALFPRGPGLADDGEALLDQAGDGWRDRVR
jgi:PAT family beta-lactamase induction signal transducer AmpG